MWYTTSSKSKKKEKKKGNSLSSPLGHSVSSGVTSSFNIWFHPSRTFFFFLSVMRRGFMVSLNHREAFILCYKECFVLLHSRW